MMKSLERIVVLIVVVLGGAGRGASVEEAPALKVLSEHGCGRATAYSEFNKIVNIGDKTHVSWLDSEDGKFLVKIQTLKNKLRIFCFFIIL